MSLYLFRYFIIQFRCKFEAGIAANSFAAYGDSIRRVEMHYCPLSLKNVRLPLGDQTALKEISLRSFSWHSLDDNFCVAVPCDWNKGDAS